MRSLASACLALVAIGCTPKAAAPASEPLELAKGTEVELMLLTELEAGKAREGEEVPFVVAKDVTGPGGEVLIRAGAPGRGVVTWSRSEGTLSALANQPARLAVRLEEVEAVDGQKVRLQTEDDAYQFTRKNTGPRGSGRDELGRIVEDLMKEPASRDNLEKLSQAFQEGGNVELRAPTTQDLLRRVKGTETLLREGEIEKAESLIDRIKQGGTATAILGGSTLATVAAVGELAHLADEVGSRLGRMLKGRTIRAHVATPVTAEVAENVTVQPAARP